jgi:uncharacterized protein
MKKRTVVIGASPDSKRYSYMATESLNRHGHEVFPVGIHEGSIGGKTIYTDMPNIENVDTVTLYVAPRNQPYWYLYIISLNPKRIIFNPGTENMELYELAGQNDIECLTACTLVLLSLGDY